MARPLQRHHLPISPSAVLVQNAEGPGVYNLLVTPSFHLRWLWFQGGGVDLLKDTNLGLLTWPDAYLTRFKTEKTPQVPSLSWNRHRLQPPDK